MNTLDLIGIDVSLNILENLKIIDPSLVIDGVGGSKMEPFMRDQLYSVKDFKTIGIVEILFSIFKYINITF